jgi:modulator of FtsH protease HflC
MNRIALALSAAAMFVLAVVGYLSIYTINPTEQAILLQWGAPRAVETEPGLHVKIPWVQTVAFIDKRLLNVEVTSEQVLSQDGKQLFIDAYAYWRIADPIRFNEIAKTKDIAGQRLVAILDSNLRRVLGAVSMTDVLSAKREQLMHDVRADMNQETKEFGIEIVDVGLRHVNLPQESGDAVFARMQQEREREATQFRAEGSEIAVRIRARADREVTIIKAEATREADIQQGEGDAEKTRILGEAYGQDPEFAAFYRSMQAYQEAFPASNTTAVLSPGSEFFRYFQQAPGSGARESARPHKH